MTSFGTVLMEEQRGERRKALRTLLQQPLITAGGPNADRFVLIRRHASELNEWLAKTVGWSLFVDSETARLRKLPENLADDTRGAVGKQPFNRRRYALFALALAALGQGDRQTTLGRLFERILQLAAGDEALNEAGLRPDPNRRDHRRDLVTAVHLMLDLGLLHQVDGDETAFLGGRGDVLYNVNRSALSWVLNVRRSPSTVEAETLPDRMEAITAEPQPETAEGRNRRIRLALYRKLLDDPVVYYDQLTEDERAYLNSQRPKIVREIESFTGLRAEIRREGMAMVDESGDLTDQDMLSEGTDGHVALLIASYLAGRLRKEGPKVVGNMSLQNEMVRLAAKFGKYWRKDARVPEAVGPLIAGAIARLHALNLVALDQDGVIPRPALARYALEEPRISGGAQSQEELF